MSALGHLEKIHSLGIVGASGLVGRELLEILDEYRVHIGELRLFGSAQSAGENIDIGGGRTADIEELTADSFVGLEVAFFSIPALATRRFIPVARAAGCLVVDDSSVYRMEKEVPLVVPQINGQLLSGFNGNLISTPNCTTTPLAMALKPLHDQFGLRRVVVSTYQSVSGAGRQAEEELSAQTTALFNGRNINVEVFPHRIAFNCIPQIGRSLDNGNCEEEEKMIHELRKIFNLPQLRVSASCVRVPTFNGHGMTVNVELEKDFGSLEDIREALDDFEGVQVLDQPTSHIYPTNVECTKSNDVFIGRLRRDASQPATLNFWVITDNLRKGAALNALEILNQYYSQRD